MLFDTMLQAMSEPNRKNCRCKGKRGIFRSSPTDAVLYNTLTPPTRRSTPRPAPCPAPRPALRFAHCRNSGIAFEFGDSTYDQANKTMSSYTVGTLKKGKEKGIKKDIRGFWLDVVVSPYAAFGVECERVNEYAEGLFQVLNKGTGTEQNRHHTVEVATYNIMSYLWEIETNKMYEMRKKNDIFSGLGEDASDVIVYANGEAEVADPSKEPKADDASVADKPPPVPNTSQPLAPPTLSQAEKQERMEKKRIRQAASRARNIVEAIDNVKFFPICGTIDSMYNKSKFTKKVRARSGAKRGRLLFIGRGKRVLRKFEMESSR